MAAFFMNENLSYQHDSCLSLNRYQTRQINCISEVYLTRFTLNLGSF